MHRKKRSEKQKNHVKFMSTVRHRSRDEAIPAATELPTPRANILRLNRRIIRLKKDIVNAARREQRLREKLAKKSEEATTLTPANRRDETALHEIGAELSRSNEEVREIQKTVERLRAEIKGGRGGASSAGWPESGIPDVLLGEQQQPTI